ncbi:hypothetical protein ACFSCX_19150 [Bacillus salitolerans]|uniref:Uncharacterized protein n=1 Tax=Bacillus salitolerans TaxID=1437434 RepID=A0ABW4LVV8_9BACI
MNINQVIKAFAFISILAGVVRLSMTPTGLIWGTDSTPELLCGYIASILMAFSSIAFYLPQAKQTGVLGLISIFLLTLGNILISGDIYGILGYGDYAEDNVFTMITGMTIGIGMAIGTLLLAYVTIRAKVFPIWIPILHILTVLTLSIPFLSDWFAFVWGLAYVAMGYTVYSGNFKKNESTNLYVNS